MIRRAVSLLACSAALLLFDSAAPSAPASNGASATAPAEPPTAASPAVAAKPIQASPAGPAQPALPSPPFAQRALDDGVLIVVSLPRQRMFVFKDGALWGSSPVSTGRRGHGTPVGLFPILQKSVRHRSTLYNNAPMPYMQRLTWGGVALHAGHVPGYRASHGCIRVPRAFARKLFAITSTASTAVLVTRVSLASAESALGLAGGRASPPVLPAREDVDLAAAPAPLAATGIQTIQLTAARSPRNAAAYWQQLVERQPQLAALEHEIVPAIVNSRKFYRLRASGPGAAAICNGLASAGVACLKVSA